MWETTLIGKPNDLVYFLDLKNNLKDIFGQNALVVITFEKDLICSIALISDRQITQAKSLIYETIIKIVKVEYLTENLQVLIGDRSLNSYFVSSIVSLEIADEVKYAMQTTKLSNCINIRSFVNFKLHKFFEIWAREVDYYNFHFAGEDKGNYLDFLKFLANNINSKSEIMYLEESSNEMLILDQKRKKLKLLNKGDDVGIIANLVMLAPKKLIINCINALSEKVTNLISYIFEDRVSVLL